MFDCNQFTLREAEGEMIGLKSLLSTWVEGNGFLLSIDINDRLMMYYEWTATSLEMYGVYSGSSLYRHGAFSALLVDEPITVAAR
jgi:hypothetical protein